MRTLELEIECCSNQLSISHYHVLFTPTPALVSRIQIIMQFMEVAGDWQNSDLVKLVCNGCITLVDENDRKITPDLEWILIYKGHIHVAGEDEYGDMMQSEPLTLDQLEALFTKAA